MSIKILLLSLLFMLNLWANERIVSLSPSITEILYALDKSDALVATSEYSLYPKEAQKLPLIGGYSNANIEKILSHSPSLVVGEHFNAKTLQQLNTFHIQTLMLHLNTIENIKKSIVALGEVIDKKASAKRVVATIQKAIQEAPKTLSPHKVMIVYGLKEDLRSGIYIAGKGIFFNDIIKLTNNKNAYDDASTSQPVLNYENVIALNPDQIIILHSHATQPNVDLQKALKAWYAIPTNASKNGKISIIDEDYLHIPSHRVALTIERLAREIHD